ncbi:osmotically inducible protein OsmC [Kitasatospora sp. NPDC101155]|uniref:osmotically inducible protein OsmC n=1 Tax=Kitasatospora sp. NPDC101155 TaxID=3364097 RepID=UPI00380D3935
MPVNYTATVEVAGEGRNGGTARSTDGLLEHRLSIPKELGGAGDATNPEQLFAAGWAACYLGALLHGDDGEFSLLATLAPRLGGVDQRTAEELAEAAHRICPYSKATRGNIPVTINAAAV